MSPLPYEALFVVGLFRRADCLTIALRTRLARRARYLDRPVRAARVDPFVVTCLKRAPRGDDEWARGEALTAVVDGHRAIEAFMEFAPGLSIAAAARAREDLQEMRRHRDRVVVGDGGVVLEAEDGLGITSGRPGSKGGVRIRGRLREAEIVALEKVGQKGFSGVEIGDAGEPEFDDEAILPPGFAEGGG